MSNVEGINLQNCTISGRLNFSVRTGKNAKNKYFQKTPIPQHLLKEANIQASTCETSRPTDSKYLVLIGCVRF